MLRWKNKGLYGTLCVGKNNGLFAPSFYIYYTTGYNIYTKNKLQEHVPIVIVANKNDIIHAPPFSFFIKYISDFSLLLF